MVNYCFKRLDLPVGEVVSDPDWYIGGRGFDPHPEKELCDDYDQLCSVSGCSLSYVFIH